MTDFYTPMPNYEMRRIHRRQLAEKILLKLIEIAPQMMRLDANDQYLSDPPKLSELAWKFADVFLKNEELTRTDP